MYSMPALGTMAHSFIQAFGDENRAFDAYVREFPQTTTLLVDTYDTLTGVERAINVAHAARNRGAKVNAIRLDSGDLSQLAKSARSMLDAAGLQNVQIIASGGLDEHSIAELIRSRSPIDAFGVGTRFGTSADAPYIDSVYKLVEIDGRPVIKLSSAKATRPWAKQVFRGFEQSQMRGDMITKQTVRAPEDYPHPMLDTVMRSGERLHSHEPISSIRKRVEWSIQCLPERYRRLCDPDAFPVEYRTGVGFCRKSRERDHSREQTQCMKPHCQLTLEP